MTTNIHNVFSKQGYELLAIDSCFLLITQHVMLKLYALKQSSCHIPDVEGEVTYGAVTKEPPGA